MANRLANETSPYLRQHQDNPVDWYAWGEEAFAAARDRNVPILLSVGYSACHWCHVMAHECFEDSEVAEVTNRLFVNVKVDREERPDVDSIYMDAVQAMTGRGGWPMTVFLTPDGKPFFGGTYFPKPTFLQLLAAIDDVWRNKPADVQQNVGALMEAIDRTRTVAAAKEVPGAPMIDLGLQQLAKSFDGQWGGFGPAPKFPSTNSIELLLRSHLSTGRPDIRGAIDTTLQAMASGGMYDHLGGGFARYSTDEKWLVPHFEKMLYDQALVARIYVRAALVFDDPVYRQVASETIDYVLRELRHPDGGFFSAEDADSLDAAGHSHEGAFYVWTADEVRAAAGADADAALEWYEFTRPENAEGNFEGKVIPARLFHRGDLLRPEAVERARVAMLAVRATRSRPGLDDKVLTEWNGLMLATIAEAAAAFGRADWLAAAVANGEFLVRELRSPTGRWSRSWQADGSPRARHAALANDHTALVDAFTRLAEATGEARWIAHATEAADTLLDHFWDLDHGGLFTTADDAEQLVVRQKDFMDNATPSANSTAAIALYRLAALTGELRYANLADQILQLLATVIPKAPTAFSNALAAIDMRASGTTEIAVVGDRPDLLAVVRSAWRPNSVVTWGEPFDSPLWDSRKDGFVYVCRDFACQQPTDDIETLRTQLG
ncbi:MAG: thioredoxin domain-containing protein [Actinobacteria bacterium]|nr:thioredoxin domain-containing protein [Actinomycetota bacterium]